MSENTVVSNDTSAASALAAIGMSMPSFGETPSMEKVSDVATGAVTTGSEVHRETGGSANNIPASQPFQESQPGKVPDEFKPRALDIDNLLSIQQPQTQTQQEASSIPASPEQRSRDLSRFPPEYHKQMRQMSNDAFALVSKWFDDAQTAPKLKTELEALQAQRDSWKYGHEESYKLAPEYQQFQQVAERLNVEEGFWKEQLVNYKAGKPAYLLVQGPDGQLHYSAQPLPANSPEVEIQLQENWAKVKGFQTQIGSQQAQWLNNFKSEVSGVHGKVVELQKSLFPNGYSEALKPEAEKVLNWLPQPYRTQPIFQIAAGLYAAVIQANQVIAQLKQQGTARSTIQAASGQVAPQGASAHGNATGVINDQTSAASVMQMLRPLIDAN
jgi:hypothetical protein